MRVGWKPLISFSWREGKYLDLWSVVHVLSGVALGFAAYFTPLQFSSALVIAIALFILYEWFEAVLKIGEVLENRFVDVVLDTVGFIFAYRFVETYFTKRELFFALGALLLVLATLAYCGWRARQKRQQH